MKNNKIKIFLTIISSIHFTICSVFGQNNLQKDSIPIYKKSDYSFKINNDNFFYSIKKNIKDSSFILVLLANDKEIYRRTFAKLDGSFLEYDEFDVFENNKVVPFEIGMIRYVGFFDSNYIFEVFRFSREGLSVMNIIYSKNLILEKEIINFFDKNGCLKSNRINYYVPSK